MRTVVDYPPQSGPAGTDEKVLPWWMNPVNIVVMVVAAAVLAAAIGFVFGESRGKGAKNESDIGFLQDMRIHHEQAVNMGLIYLDVSASGMGDGSDSRGILRLIAREIIVNQSNESGRMVQILRQFDAAETNETDEVMGWMGEPVPLARMPGYATDEEMRTLQQSRGAEADRLFAKLMIAHHKGGVHMAEHAGMHGSSDEVRAMADSMVKAQNSEIAEMKKLLAAAD
ncbi:MAG: DUF305 domain-containing protein [Actinobacteria bacterium]|nr:DUF305 domain-containing protein [Actinomycetota bacterium]